MATGHYAGVFIHNFPKKMADMRVLGVWDKRFLKRPYDPAIGAKSLIDNGDVKVPGGMPEDVRNGGGNRKETPLETMAREGLSETGVQILMAEQVYLEEVVDRQTGGKHLRYFYIATRVSGLPELDSPIREVDEANADGTKEHLYSCWLPLEQFAKQLYKGQRPAFGAILSWLARDSEKGAEFVDAFMPLLEQFPEPEPGV